MRAEAQQAFGKGAAPREALANELAKAQQVIETQVALASKRATRRRSSGRPPRARRRSCDSPCRRSTTGPRRWRASWRRHGGTSRRSWRCRARRGDEAAQRKQAAENATAELRQSLQKEHDRAEALAGELAKARRDLETQVALSSKAGDEAAQRQAGRRERDGGAATVPAEGARQGRGAGWRACEGAAGPRDAGGAVEQGGRRGGAGQDRPPRARRRSCDSRCRRSTTGPRR